MPDDLLTQCQDELSGLMWPWPDDYVEEASPPAGLLYGRQLAMALLKVAVGAVASIAGDVEDDPTTAHEVLNGVATAVAGFTHALVALEVLPPEAEEALAAGVPG